MRVARVLFAFVFLLLAVCRKWDNPFDPASNRPPFIPSEPFPDSDAAGVDTGAVLRWTGGDPDTFDTVSHRVYFGATSSPVLVESALAASQYKPRDMTALVSYYWRVVSFDRYGESAAGPLWRFRTGQANRAPNPAAAPLPDSGSTGLWHRPVLSWSGSDPDTTDTLYYDVYLGPTQAPTPAVQHQRADSFRPAALLYDTTYYWKVVTTDQHGAQKSGPLWRFRTAASVRVTAPGDSTRWPVGTQQTILWAGGPSAPAADSSVVYRSSNGGANWSRHGRATTPGSYVWTVPGPVTTSARVQVRLYVRGDTNAAASPNYQVTDTTAPSTIFITSPSGGERWAVGSRHDVTWTGGTDGMDSTVVFYTTNGGLNWLRQGKTLTAGRFPWAVPGPTVSGAKVLVRAYSLSRSTEALSSSFDIIEPPYPDTVLATVAVGARPRAMAWDSTDGRLYVANYTDSSVSVIDGASNQVVTTIRVGLFPYALCWNPTGGRVYVANYGSNTVSVINAGSNQVVATLAVGSNPSALCWNATDNRVYVADNRSASVTVIDGARDSVVTTVAVDSGPCAVVWVASVNSAYVANFSRNSVSVIDGTTNGIVATVPVGYAPAALAIDPNDNVAVANRNAGTLSIINTANNSVYTTINVETEPYAMCASPTAHRLFVANSGTGNVSLINTQNYTLAGSTGVGSLPRSINRAHWVDKVYVANYDGRSVSIIDAPSGAVLRTVSAGARPTAVTVNHRDNKVYVANYDDGTVSIIGAVAD